jgi:hypothetical protein
MQQLIENWNLEQKRISAEEYCLGSLIEDLKNIKSDLIVEIDNGTFPLKEYLGYAEEGDKGDKKYEDGYFKGFFKYNRKTLSVFDSWRGRYCELSMQFSNNNQNITVNDLLTMAEFVNGKFLGGYKGGDYLMNLETPIHIANYGSCGNTKLVGVYEHNGKAILKTRIEDE